MSSSSRDLLPEMMESETPPLVAPSHEAGDPEVSSRRVFPSPDPEKGRQASPALSGARSDVRRDLLEQAAISEEHRTLRGTVIERISSAESGLHEAFMSLLTGFKVREMIYICDGTAHFRCALCR